MLFKKDRRELDHDDADDNMNDNGSENEEDEAEEGIIEVEKSENKLQTSTPSSSSSCIATDQTKKKKARSKTVPSDYICMACNVWPVITNISQRTGSMTVLTKSTNLERIKSKNDYGGFMNRQPEKCLLPVCPLM